MSAIYFHFDTNITGLICQKKKKKTVHYYFFFFFLNHGDDFKMMISVKDSTLKTRFKSVVLVTAVMV